MIAYIHYFDFYKPASVEVLIESTVNIVEFKTLNPEPIIQFWDKDFTFEKFLKEKNGWIHENYLFLLALLLFVAVLVLLVILMIVGIKRDEIREFLQKTFYDFFFNKMILTYKIAFFK